MTLIETIIYLAGFLATYILCKKIRNEHPDQNNNWADVLRTIFCSMFSWLSFAVLLMLYGVYLTAKKIKIKTPKPPKFL